MSGEFEQAVPAGKEIGRKIEAFLMQVSLCFVLFFPQLKQQWKRTEW